MCSNTPLFRKVIRQWQGKNRCRMSTWKLDAFWALSFVAPSCSRWVRLAAVVLRQQKHLGSMICQEMKDENEDQEVLDKIWLNPRGKSIPFISMDWLICTMKLRRTFSVGGGVTVLSTMLVISKIQSFDHKMSIFHPGNCDNASREGGDAIMTILFQPVTFDLLGSHWDYYNPGFRLIFPKSLDWSWF